MTTTSKYYKIFFFLLFLGNLQAQTISTIEVSGACEMCKETIEKTTGALNGVISSKYDLNSHILTLETEEDFDLDYATLALNYAGYDTKDSRAKDEMYDNLPLCCAYRGTSNDVYIAANEKVKIKSDASLKKIIKGHIYEEGPDSLVPLIGANIYWITAQSGAVTNDKGEFEIGRISSTDSLVVSYIGYENQVIDMSHKNDLDLTLFTGSVLQEVEVKHRNRTSAISHLQTIQTLKITEQEICKAACCSLSESFETTPSIDVSFTDAITGTRQIQMLGLAGKYVQITRELIPSIRGLATIQGLGLVPGDWIESIQLSKGTGSVANGYESMTGQINLELRKPETADTFRINLYGNEGGRYESNIHFNHKFNKNLSTGVMLHGSTRQQRHDRNNDGFLDMPLKEDYFLVNRWKYSNADGWQGQLGIKVSDVESVSGQKEFFSEGETPNEWGAQSLTDRKEAWIKFGKVLNEDRNSSFGSQFSYLTHDQESTFGNRNYDSNQESFYGSVLYQTNLSGSEHTLKTGFNFVYDDISENVDEVYDFDRLESVIGVFGEYTFKPNEKLSVVSGLRLDHHNEYGVMFVPRVHSRYEFDESNVIRFSLGKGWRTANLFAENPGIFASNRQWNISPAGINEYGYGLDPEQSWNLGLNWTHQFIIGTRLGSLSLDYYATSFTDQIIEDRESDPDGTVIFANQDEAILAHSAQVQIDYEILERFDVRWAYRYNYSEAMYGQESKTQVFNPFHKSFINLAYQTKKNWYFDLTVNWRGEQRIPNTDWMPVDLKLDEMSPSFFLANAQIRKVFSGGLDVYLGMENIFDFRQDNPIVSSNDPTSKYFDGSLVWGPIFGRNVYAGMRYAL